MRSGEALALRDALENGKRFAAVARYGGRSLYPALLIPAPAEEVAAIHAAFLL